MRYILVLSLFLFSCGYGKDINMTLVDVNGQSHEVKGTVHYIKDKIKYTFNNQSLEESYTKDKKRETLPGNRFKYTTTYTTKSGVKLVNIEIHQYAPVKKRRKKVSNDSLDDLIMLDMMSGGGSFGTMWPGMGYLFNKVKGFLTEENITKVILEITKNEVSLESATIYGTLLVKFYKDVGII